MNTFSDHYYRVYSAKKWTFEHLFCIFVYFIIFALPFYFCFASKSTNSYTQIFGSNNNTLNSLSTIIILATMLLKLII